MNPPFTNPQSRVSPPPAKYGNCPRCRVPLADPDGLGYCAGCGYCRSLEQDRKAAALVAPPPAEPRKPATRLGAAEFFSLMALAPTWIWVLTFVTLAVGPISFFADRRLPPSGTPDRGYWSAGQLGVGILLLVMGQAWALSMLWARGERLGVGEMVWPFRLWVRAARWLPDTRWPLALGASGFAAGLAAVFWVGGFSFWLTVHTEEDEAELVRLEKKHQRAAERSWIKQEAERIAAGRGGDSPGGSGREKVTLPAPADTPPPASRDPQSAENLLPTTQCVILGYMSGTGGGVSALVLGTLRDGKLHYAGVVRKGIGPAESAALRARLAGRKRDLPLINGVQVDAVWVEPELFCDVYSSGVDAGGVLIAPSLKGLVEE